MSPRARNLVGGVVVLGLLAVVVVATREGPSLGASALANLPAHAAIVLVVPLGALEGTPIAAAAEALFGTVFDPARWTELCGAHPLDGLDELAVFALAAADGVADLGVVAAGVADRDRLGVCVNAALAAEGVVARASASRAGVDAVAAGRSEVLLVPPDGVVTGNAAAIAATLAVLRGEAPSLRSAPLGELAEEVQGAGAVLAVELPEHWRSALADLAARGVGTPPELTQSVRALAAGLHPDGDGAKLVVALRGGPPADIERALTVALARLGGSRGLFSDVAVRRAPGSVVVEARIDGARLVAAARSLATPPSSGASTTPPADEVLVRRVDAGT